jgi:hypothetical protein
MKTSIPGRLPHAGAKQPSARGTRSFSALVAKLLLGVRAHPVSFALLPVVSTAFALRVHGIDFGLPHLYYWDEPTVVNRSVRFGSGDLNPSFFVYPALYMYIIFVFSGLYFCAGYLLGSFSGVIDFATRYFVDPSGVYLMARLLTAFIGTTTVVMTFLVGRRYFNSLVGYIGAAFLTVSVLHASYSHIATADIPHSFLIMAAYLPLHDVAAKGRLRDYLFCAVLIGLGIAMKYLAFLLALCLLLAHLIGSSEKSPQQMSHNMVSSLIRQLLSPKLVLAGMAMIGAFFIGSPYNFLSFSAFLEDVRDQSLISTGEGGNSLRYFLLHVLPADVGWPLYLTAAVGVLLILVRRQSLHLLFFSFPVIYLAFNVQYERVFPRYMIPVTPFLALLAAYALVQVFDWLRSSAYWRRPAIGLLATATIAIAALPAYTVVSWNRTMASELDTRTAALHWTNRNVAPGTIVAIQPLFDRTFNNVPLQTQRTLAKLEQDIPSGGRFDAVRARVFAALEARPTFVEAEFVYDLDALRRNGVRYVFISDQNWSRPHEVASSDAGVARSPDSQLRYDLEAKATLVAVFKSSLRSTPTSAGVLPVLPPEIRVYELR